jgi:hypothetical protein
LQGLGVDEAKFGVCRIGRFFQKNVAEREGFEPSMELSPHTRLAGERLKPSRPSLRGFLCHALHKFFFLAEGVGFEPTVPVGTTVFKTAAFNHSAIPPRVLIYEYNKACLDSQNI